MLSAGVRFPGEEGELSSIAIVGAGAAGRSLGRGLYDAGWSIRAVVTRSRASAESAVRAIGSGRPYENLTRWVLEADVVLIATPEEDIRTVGRELARMGGEEWKGKVVLHAGRSLNGDALSALGKLGADTGSIRPMQLFQRRGLSRLEGVLFAVEGSPGAVKKARKIARDLGGVPIELLSGTKRLCGAAAEAATAHVLGFLGCGVRLLADAGFSQRQATQAALHLCRAALHNFERFGGAQAWRAASSHGDPQAIAERTKALADYPSACRSALAAAEEIGAAVFARIPRGASRR